MPAATEQVTLFECDQPRRRDDLRRLRRRVRLPLLGQAVRDDQHARRADRGLRESFPLSEAAYVSTKDASDIEFALDDLLEDDPLEQTRRKVKTYYLGDFDEANYADGFIETARRYI